MICNLLSADMRELELALLLFNKLLICEVVEEPFPPLVFPEEVLVDDSDDVKVDDEPDLLDENELEVTGTLGLVGGAEVVLLIPAEEEEEDAMRSLIKATFWKC